MANDTIGTGIQLASIATEIILKELKRRAVAKGMTTEELIAEAQKNWDQAEEAAEDLRDRP